MPSFTIDQKKGRLFSGKPLSIGGTLQAPKEPGVYQYSITLRTDDTKEPLNKVPVQVTVRASYQLFPKRLLFSGPVDADSSAIHRSLTIVSRRQLRQPQLIVADELTWVTSQLKQEQSIKDGTWRYDFDVSCVPPTDGTRIGRGNLLLTADGSDKLSVRIPIVYVKSEASGN